VISVFVSYSHKDEKLWNKLRVHLAALIDEGLIDLWHDRRIEAGDDFNGKIDEALNTADLVSPKSGDYFSGLRQLELIWHPKPAILGGFRSPQPPILHTRRNTKTPSARNGLGVLHAARAAEMQDAREVAGELKVDPIASSPGTILISVIMERMRSMASLPSSGSTSNCSRSATRRR
jgi:hypothetical protein